MKVIKAISISDRKGVRKKNIDSVLLRENFGLENDAHGGDWHRQVSFLAQESINFMREKGLDVVAGNFAENITTEGIDLVALKVGTHLQIGATELVISQLGKICHNRCAIYHQAGDCVMPREGIFAVVLKGGQIKVGDQIHVLNSISQSAALVATDKDEELYGKLIREKIYETRVPVFIRFDSLSSKQSTIEAILKDLTDTQHTDDIIIFDPSGGCGLALAGYEKSQVQSDTYIKNGSTIYYVNTLEDLHRKSNFT
jgi:molybdopterin adenylyltransferase